MENKVHYLAANFFILLSLVLTLSNFPVFSTEQNDLDNTRRPPRRTKEKVGQKPSRTTFPRECNDTNTGLQDCQLTLPNFQRGHFDHPGIKDFVKTVVRTIQAYKRDTSNNPIPRITIQGFADGIHNSGVSDWRNVPFSDCRIKEVGKLLDADLARIRGCVVKQELLKLIGDGSLIRDRTNELPPIDFEDGVNIGDEFRKVEVTFKKVSNKND